MHPPDARFKYDINDFMWIKCRFSDLVNHILFTNVAAYCNIIIFFYELLTTRIRYSIVPDEHLLFFAIDYRLLT